MLSYDQKIGQIGSHYTNVRLLEKIRYGNFEWLYGNLVKILDTRERR